MRPQNKQTWFQIVVQSEITPTSIEPHQTTSMPQQANNLNYYSCLHMTKNVANNLTPNYKGQQSQQFIINNLGKKYKWRIW